MILAAIDPWSWRPHPEVWILIAGIIALGYYTTHVIAPKLVTTRGDFRPTSADTDTVATRAPLPSSDGGDLRPTSVDTEMVATRAPLPSSDGPELPDEVVTLRQKRFFVLGVVSLAIAADWPMHDIAEQYLYSVHMFQHLLITFFIPIFFLQATPTWLARLIVGSDSAASSVLRRLAKPIVAGIIFNLLAALTHWNGIVQLSADSGPFHYTIHLVMFSSALLMWLPVLGPIPELRLSPPAQLIYLFCMSIIPTIPAGWLTFADNVVYPAYDTPERLWGISVISDQQAAGFIMKIVGGLFLWALIAVRFFRWSKEQRASDYEKKIVRPLTYEDVQEEFDKSPAPEPTA